MVGDVDFENSCKFAGNVFFPTDPNASRTSLILSGAAQSKNKTPLKTPIFLEKFELSLNAPASKQASQSASQPAIQPSIHPSVLFSSLCRQNIIKMAASNTNNNNNEGGALAPNAAFSALVRRSTTAAGALAAEDHATNPWTSPSRARSGEYFRIRESARALPAAASREAFLDLYHKNQVIILTGDTGSGKTTQVPQFVYVLTKPCDIL